MIAVTPEKCTIRNKGKKVSFRMWHWLYRDWLLLEQKKPLVRRSKLFNQAIQLFLRENEKLIADRSDIPLIADGLTDTTKRPTTKKKPAKKKMKVKAKK